MDLSLYVISIVTFFNNFIIPTLLGVALLLFIINAIRYFVIESSNQDSREKARSLALYSILAFVFILVFWGVVNLFSQSLGLSGYGVTNQPCFDYDPNC